MQLIAVTKGFGADAIVAAVNGGCAAIGENYAQELLAKLAELPPGMTPEVHFIGHVQTNKVRSMASAVDVWQTIDRPSAVAEVAKRAGAARVFVQVNTTNESGKGGCMPTETTAIVAACREAGLQVEGLMTIGPTSMDVADTHQSFALLRRLADDHGLSGCSMGMTADLDIALEHGATHVRIGSALFGDRPQRGTSIK